MSATKPRHVTRIIDLAEHHGLGAQPLVRYRQVEAAGRALAAPPRFMFGPSSPALARQFFGQIDLRPVGCYAIDDAAVAPTGVVTKGQIAFCTPSTNHPRPHVEKIAKAINDGGPPERHVEGQVVPLFGPAHDTFGHVTIDYLPKLWVLHKAGYDLASLSFLVPRGLSPAARTLLHAAGITERQCITYAYGYETITADRVVIPTLLRSHERLSHCYGEAARFWANRVKAYLAAHAPAPATPPPARIFLSRSGVGGTRTLLNRNAIEALASRYGFAVIAPETLTLAEQVSLLDGARQIAGEYGSALHNTIFSRPGAVALALRGTLSDPGCIQTSLAAALGQGVGYVFGETEGADRDQRFTISERDFFSALDVLSVTLH